MTYAILSYRKMRVTWDQIAIVVILGVMSSAYTFHPLWAPASSDNVNDHAQTTKP